VCAGQPVGHECSLGDIESSLIPNPSFEERTGCPTSFSQLHHAVTWLQATSATSDYYVDGKPCSVNFNGGFFDLPPAASDGVAYVGTAFVSASYMEYVGGCLLNPLVAGTAYTFTIDVSANNIGAKAGGVTNGDSELLCVASCGSIPAVGTGWMGSTFPVLASASPGGGIGDGTWKALTFAFTPSSECAGVIFGPARTQTIQAGKAASAVFYDALNLQDGVAGGCNAVGECVPGR
jgi:hypothetical protein